jgi:hypothetical protein
MPRGDGTGPTGLGPMTGRGAGFCAGYAAPGFTNTTLGCCGRGWGNGRGLRRMNQVYGNTGYPGVTLPFADVPELERAATEREVSWLSKRVEVMEQALQNAKERLENLTKNQE